MKLRLLVSIMFGCLSSAVSHAQIVGNTTLSYQLAPNNLQTTSTGAKRLYVGDSVVVNVYAKHQNQLTLDLVEVQYWFEVGGQSSYGTFGNLSVPPNGSFPSSIGIHMITATNANAVGATSFGLEGVLKLPE